MIFTGLYLAQEFSVFPAIQHDDQQVGIVSFSLNERIYDTDNIDWDQHMRRSYISPVHDWEKIPSESSPTSLHELFNVESRASQEDSQGRKIFLVHGHAEEPKQAVASFLRSVSLEVVILHEQANQGRQSLRSSKNILMCALRLCS